MLKQIHSTQSLINEIIDDDLPKNGELSDTIRYAALPAGKCLRAHLLIKSAEAFDVTVDTVLTIAAAVELIHAYSLAHDDLPALDNDDTRRGKLSCHKAFGEANAILAGNALLVLAFGIIGKHIPSATTMVAKFTNFMIKGQACDIILQNSNDIQHIIGVYKMKTGALFAMAATLGGSLASCTASDIAALEEYGYKIGIAFQIADDLSDKSGLMRVIDKNQIILLIDKIINEAKCALDSISIDTSFFFEFADYMVRLELTTH